MAEPRRTDCVRHLGECADCGARFARLVPLAASGAGEVTAEVRPAALVSGPVAAAPDYPPGTRVGRYEVLGELGAGGMGKVYLARDPELARTVALKLVHELPGNSDSSGKNRARLLREAQAMAQVSHPNVVPVYDVGTHEGHVFLAMEHVEGGTLKQWVKARPRPWRETVEAFAAAGDGLAAAHARGLVHRDFKPDNVVVGRDGRARVLDFGLARPVGAGLRGSAPPPLPPDAPDSDASLTAEGMVHGTRGYIAPELITGSPADPRSDQFAFGAALHWALFGQLPFVAPTMAEYAKAVLEGEPAPVPRGDVPEAVVSIVRRTLARDPAQRFESMAALLEALRRAAGGGRPRLAPWAVAVATLALLAGGLAIVALRRPAPVASTCADEAGRFTETWSPAHRDAVRASFEKTQAPFARAGLATASAGLDRLAAAWEAAWLDTCRATRERKEQPEEEMLLRKACLERQRAEVGSLVGQFESADARVVELAAQAVGTLPDPRDCANVRSLSVVAKPPADPAVQKELEQLRRELASASALPSVGRPADAVARFTSVAKRAGELKYRPLEAEALYALGLASLAQGDQIEAARALERAVEAAEAGHADRLAVKAASRLIAVNGILARGEEGQRWIERTRVLFERVEQDSALLGDVAYNAGFLAMQLGHYQEAIEAFGQAMPLRVARYGPEHTETLMVHVNLGAAYDELAMPREAIEHDLAAIRGFERSLGQAHPRLVVPLANLALLYARVGDLEAAAPFGARALEVALATLGPRSHKTGVVRLTLSRLRHDEGQVDQALSEAREAGAVFLEKSGDKTDTYGLSLSAEAAALLAGKKVPEAVRKAQQSVAVLEASNPDRVELTEALTVLGEAQLASKKPADALVALERALRISAAHKRYPGELGRTRLAAARALQAAKKDPKRVEELARQARDDLAALPTRQADVAVLDRFLAGQGRL